MAADPKNHPNDLENYQNFVSHSIIGVVGDVRREMGGHHYAEVFAKLKSDLDFNSNPDLLRVRHQQ